MTNQNSTHLSCLYNYTKENTDHLGKEEIKFLYKKDKLNKSLYRTHLQAAQEWGKTWDLIRGNMHTTLNLEVERMYKNVDDKISRLANLQIERADEKFKF